jgi:hypothetical protein
VQVVMSSGKQLEHEATQLRQVELDITKPALQAVHAPLPSHVMQFLGQSVHVCSETL